MKKIILLFITLPILGFNQFYKWDIGLNGGVNINNPIVNNATLDEVNYQGNLYGLTVIYHFNRFLAIKADLDIENRGWVMKNYNLNHENANLNQNGNLTTNLENVTQVLDYFDVPAFMHIGFGKKFKVDLNIGPYFGFKIKDEIYSYDPDGNKLNADQTRREIGLYEDGFDNFDFGLVYGIGFDYQLHERFSIGFDALYERGMKVINAGDYKNSSIDFDFGINFHLGKKKKK